MPVGAGRARAVAADGAVSVITAVGGGGEAAATVTGGPKTSAASGGAAGSGPEVVWADTNWGKPAFVRASDEESRAVMISACATELAARQTAHPVN